MNLKRLFLISIFLLLAIPTLADQDRSSTPEDRTQFFRDVVIDSSHPANVVQCFGCSVHVRGHVTGDIVTVGGSIYVSGMVDGDAVAFGGHVEAQAGGELKGDAIALGGYATGTGGGKLDRKVISTPYAILPGQYRPTPLGVFLLIATNLLCVALAGALLRATRIKNTAWTIWNRKNMVLLTGCVALLVIWGMESLGRHLGRFEDSADMLLGLAVVVIGSAGATGLGRLVGGVAFPKMAPIRATLAGILALSMLEVIPLFGFFVLTVGLLIALGAAIVSGFGSRAVPAAESNHVSRALPDSIHTIPPEDL